MTIRTHLTKKQGLPKAPSKSPIITPIPQSLHTNDLQNAVEKPSAETLTPQIIRTLQRTHGNHFVQRLVDQSKTQSMLSTQSADTIQRLPQHLMTKDEFERRKDEAVTRKKLGRKRSSSDYKDLYNAYDKLIGKGRYIAAYDKLSEIQTKIGRMNHKTYWQPNMKTPFLQDVMASIKNESAWVQAMKEQQEAQIFEGEISITIEDIARSRGIQLTSPIGWAENGNEIFRNQQKVRMISESLGKAVSIDGRIKDTLQDEDFIDALFGQVFGRDPITYNDVLNEIATLLPTHGHLASDVQTDTMQNRINAVTGSGLSPVEKLAEVGQLLWGSFDWYVNSDSIEKRDTNQLDAFILWLTDPTDQIPEPTDTSQMNCWEGVIFMIYKAGFVSKLKLKSLYTGKTKDTAGVGLAYQLLQVGNHTVMYQDETFNGQHPQKGAIVSIWQGNMSGEPHHVVLSLGQDGMGNDEVMSLWTGQTGGMLGKTTIQNLLGQNVIIAYNTPTMPFV